ncbi:MAG: hypothetical protein WCK10_03610, partial [Candidatus Staskawiczbacteria bacterium]
VKIATKNIICWKYFGKTDKHGGISYWRDHKYYFNTKEFITDPLWPRIEDTAIDEGFHSYSKYSQICGVVFRKNIVKCIIPIGAKYFYNPNANEYVSNKIHILERMSWAERFIESSKHNICRVHKLISICLSK